MEALDRALVNLGRPPLAENRDFRLADPKRDQNLPLVGTLPIAILEKPGCAPMKFLFGFDLDVWVGPFSEVFACSMAKVTKEFVEMRIRRMLTSSVTISPRRRSIEILMQVPGSEPWLRLRVSGLEGSTDLLPAYAPYVQDV